MKLLGTWYNDLFSDYQSKNISRSFRETSLNHTEFTDLAKNNGTCTMAESLPYSQVTLWDERRNDPEWLSNVYHYYVAREKAIIVSAAYFGFV